MSHAPTGSHTGLEPVLSSLGVGRSGRATLVQLGLVSASAGALIQALTITSACAATEWGVGADRAGRLKVAMIGGEVFGAFLWCSAGDAVGRREACCLSCVLGAGGIVICAFAASFDVLVAATATVGCAVAGATLAPVVLAVERAPARFRGRYAASLALFGTGGAALAALAHAVIAAGVAAARAALGDDASVVGAQWRGACAVVALLPFGAAVSCGKRLDESPRWLLSQRRYAQCRRDLERAAARNFGKEAARPTTRVLDAALAAAESAPRPTRSFSAAALRTLKMACGVGSLCACGLNFLLAFGFFSVLSLVRLEFDVEGRADASAFFALHRRRLGDDFEVEPCASLDYAIVACALASEVGGALLARHLVDALGRRLTLAACFATAAGGVLCLAAPEYVGSIDPFSRSSLVFAMMTARGALYGATAVAPILVAEMHATDARFAAAALAYAAARLGALVSAFWVVSPNPLSTVSLLVTLVNVSAAWAALAMPVETARSALDAPDPPAGAAPPPKTVDAAAAVDDRPAAAPRRPPPPRPAIPAPEGAADSAAARAPTVLDASASAVDGEKLPLLT